MYSGVKGEGVRVALEGRRKGNDEEIMTTRKVKCVYMCLFIYAFLYSCLSLFVNVFFS